MVNAPETRRAPSPIAQRFPWRRLGWAGLMTGIWWAALTLHGWSGDARMDQAMGQWIWTHHALPHRDYWTTATAGQPFTPTEWGYAVLVALLGRTGTWLLNAALLAALAWGVTGWASEWPGRWRGMLLINGALVLSFFIPPRPEIGSYLGWWLTLETLRRYRNTGQTRWLWGMTAVVAVWATWHRSVWLVPALWGWELMAGPADRRRGLWGPLAVALLLVNLPPAGGLNGLRFMAAVFNPQLRHHIAEWRGLAYTGLYGWAGLAFAAVLLWKLAPRLWPRPQRVRNMGWLLGAVAASVFAVRLVPYAALGLGALAADLPWTSPRSMTRSASPWTWNRLYAVIGAVLCVLGGVKVVQAGGFVSPWPAGLTTTLVQAQATGVLAPEGDTLTTWGVRPWVDGQVQMDADQPWWPAWVRTVMDQTSPAVFAARWDPSSRWMVWPDRVWTPQGWRPVQVTGPWHVVWRGKMAWPQTNGIAVVTTLWHRS